LPVPAQSLLEQRAGAGSSLHQKAHRGSLGFRSVDGALRTIAGYEAMNKIRKGQIRWLARGDAVEHVRFIHQTFGVAA
jgi:hypothetical protein